MTAVSIDVRQLTGDETLVGPEKGQVWLNPFAAYQVEDGADDYLLSTEKLQIKLVDGKAEVDLPETPVNNLMKVQLRGIRGYGAPWYVQIPAGDCDLFDLPHIDPDTLDPAVPPSPAWLAALEAVETDVAANTAGLDALEQTVADLELGAASDSAVATQVGSGPLTGEALDVTTGDLVGTPGTDLEVAVAAKIAANRPINLRGMAGIYFDGVTITDNATLQAIIDAAGPGSTFDLGSGGKLILDGPITLPDNCTLRGNSQWIGVGLTAGTEINFAALTGTQVGLTVGESCTLTNILLRGPGYSSSCVGLASTAASITMLGVQFYSWGTGSSLTNCYYGSLIRCEWRFNTVGLLMSNCTNTTLTNPRFSSRNEANTTFGTGIKNTASSAGQPISIFGGSFESYGGSGTVAAIVCGASTLLNLHGVYFESATPASGAVGIIFGNNSSLVLTGCLVNLNESNRWINAAAITGAKLFARGNQFYCNTGSSSTPVAYVCGTGVEVDLDDDVHGLLKGSYTSVAVGLGHTFKVTTGNPPVATVKGYGHGIEVPQSETLRSGRDLTANRPSAAAKGAGAMFYDTTLSKPIWSNGAVWKDATGTTV